MIYMMNSLWLYLSILLIVAPTKISRAERRVTDEDYLQEQKRVLFLFAGLGHNLNESFKNEFSDFDISTNLDHFNRPEAIKQFLKAYKGNGFLPQDAVFSMGAPHTRKNTRKLFDLFYFAKDFQTFYKAASWARKHLNDMQFAYAYTLALLHRKDCQNLAFPPLYEVFPTYFVPTGTMHQVYLAKMLDVKEEKFTYNNTGYEYNYHGNTYGGPLSPDAVTHQEYKISYFREDVGLNNFYAIYLLKTPSWFCPERYGGIPWHRRGETFYYIHQQVFARYTLERLANGLPYVERLLWDSPIKLGYNPRVSHHNGKTFYTRPDNVVPFNLNMATIAGTKDLETKILGVIDSAAVWNTTDSTLLSLDDEDGIELLGKIIYGTTERPNRKYFRSYYWDAIDALGYLVKTSNEHEFVGEALSNPMTTFRDPVFYQFLNRLISLFQHHKKQFRPYSEKELGFTEVTIKGFEIDKLVTYFNNFEYDIKNGVPMKNLRDYQNYKYVVKQYRLNHKPYKYRITITADNPKEAVVRVFIGPKYDSEGHQLNLEQSRLVYFQLDRFALKLNVGDNIIERSSLESHIFSPDAVGFSSLYRRIFSSNASENYHIHERDSCGVPNRYQLPKGSNNGQPFVLAIIVTPRTVHQSADEMKPYFPCGLPRLYDRKAMGFPFDRPIDDEQEFNLPNIEFKDVFIYHQDETEINRNQQ